MKKRINNYVDKNSNWILNNLETLVSANTVNTPPDGNENNGQVIIENIFKSLGLKIDRFSPDSVGIFKDSEVYLKGRNYVNRDNLVGSIGEGKKNTLIFNGHIDTVPSHIFDWKRTKPFRAELIDEKIYGLGTCDMKGGIISSIFALKTIMDLNIPIKGEVIIESVVDEEFGGGNGSLACVEKGYIGDFAIITEPTSMDICISNVSSSALDIKIFGGGGLMYLSKEDPEETNSMVIAARLINALKDYEDFLNSLKDKFKIYSSIIQPIKFLFSDIKAGEVIPDKVLTTPRECLIRVYLENYPDVNEYEFMEMMFLFFKKYPDICRFIDNKSIIIERSKVPGGKHRFIEGGNFNLNIKRNADFISMIIENGKDLADRDLKTSAFLGGSDFFAFSNYGNTPVIVLGPGGGNCHSADEYVNFNDLIDLSKIYASLIYDYCC